MPCSCCDFTGPAAEQFNAKVAAKQLRTYRRGRLDASTRLLRDGIVESGLNVGQLVDVGAGDRLSFLHGDFVALARGCRLPIS